jgi:hypothetical protein
MRRLSPVSFRWTEVTETAIPSRGSHTSSGRIGLIMSEDKLPIVENVTERRTGNQRGRPFRSRSFLLLLTLAVVWSAVLVDPQIGPLALYVVGAFGIALAVMAAAMGLGFLGFGIFAVSDRLAGWFRRASQWPED